MSEPNISLETESGGNGEYIDPASVGGNATGDGRVTDSRGDEFDPTIHSGGFNRDGSFRRKRGRRAGSGKTSQKARADIKEAAEILTKGLLISHAALAAVSKTPELVLDEPEAQALAESGLTLLELYDIRPDPKVEAAIAFAGVLGMTYGTRIVAIRARRAQEKKEEKPGVAGVYDTNGFAAGTTTWEPGKPEWPINGAAAN